MNAGKVSGQIKGEMALPGPVSKHPHVQASAGGLCVSTLLFLPCSKFTFVNLNFEPNLCSLSWWGCFTLLPLHRLHPPRSPTLPHQPALLFSHRGDLMGLSTPPIRLPGERQSAETGKGLPPRQKPRGDQTGSPAWGQLALSGCGFGAFHRGLGFSRKH